MSQHQQQSVGCIVLFCWFVRIVLFSSAVVLMMSTRWHTNFCLVVKDKHNATVKVHINMSPRKVMHSYF